MRIFIEQRFGRYDKSGRAKAALRRAVIDEFLLNRMQRTVFARNAFNRRDVGMVGALHQHQTRADRFTILNDHATAAVSRRAAIFDASEAQLIA